LNNIHFGTAKLVKDMKNKTIMASIEQLFQAYQGRRIKINTLLGDGKFKHIQKLIEDKGINMNICASDENLLEIER